MTERAAAFEALEWDLTDRMRKAMRVGDVSVQQLADVLDVNRNTVGNYLSGRTVPARATLAAWAYLTGVPFAWLISGAVPDGPEPTDRIAMFDAVKRRRPMQPTDLLNREVRLLQVA